MQRSSLTDQMAFIHNVLSSNHMDIQFKRDLIVRSINEICKIQNRGITCWDGLKFWDNKTITTRFDVVRQLVDLYVNRLIRRLEENKKLPTFFSDEESSTCIYNITVKTAATMDKKIQLLCHLFNMPDLLEDTLKNHKVGSMEEGSQAFKKICDDAELREEEMKNIVTGALTYTFPSV